MIQKPNPIDDALRSLTDEYNKTAHYDRQSVMLKIEKLLLNKAEADPSNNDIWFQLIALEYHSPFEEPEHIIKYAKKIRDNDPDNLEALIIQAHANWLFLAGFPEDLAQELILYKTEVPEKNALIQIALGLYYQERNNDLALVQCSEAAIRNAPHFPKSYFDLGDYYWDSDRVKAKNYYSLGLKFAKVRTWGEYYVNPTDIQEFFNEYITEVYIESERMERLMKLI